MRLRLTGQGLALALAVSVFATACASSQQDTTGDTELATTATVASPTFSPTTTSTIQPAVTTTEMPTTTTSVSQDPFIYAVVAEERSRRLAVIDPVLPCTACELEPILTVDLPERPHNLAGLGSVVYATHPAAGAISRVDLATGDILTAAVAIEPHDVKPARSPTGDILYVTDEAGRRLLILDPETLDVISVIDLPGEPHDVAVTNGAAWVTLIGRDELALVEDGGFQLVRTGGSPHDLIVDKQGRVWFTSWNSDVLSLFDPDESTTVEAPAGVSEPHHFAIGPDGAVWVSDNGGSAVVGFTESGTRTVEVGSTPHHLAIVGGLIVVAVSGTGEAVLIEDESVVARVPLTPGLHGVAVAVLGSELASFD